MTWKILRIKWLPLWRKYFYVFIDELWRFNLQINPFLHTKFTQHRKLWQERLLFLACLKFIFRICQFLKDYPRDMKHKFWEIYPCPFDTTNYPKTPLNSRKTPNHLRSFISISIIVYYVIRCSVKVYNVILKGHTHLNKPAALGTL